MPFIDDLRAQREDTTNRARAILDKAIAAKRDLNPGEQREYDELTGNLASLRETIRREEEQGREDRSIADAYDRLGGKGPRHVEDKQTTDEFRSAILENNPKPIEVYDPSPRSFYQPGLERRDLVKTSPANMSRVSFHSQLVEHMVETSAVMRAGATVLTTSTGEDLRVPRSTGLSTATLTAEAAAISESDPTLTSYTLGAFKYAVLVQVSRELVDDAGFDIQGYLARETGVALGLALGNHLINGTGSGQPRGVLADTTAGITGPTGTATTLGTQATAGMGTDLLEGLAGSLAEPYTLQPSAAFLLRTSALTIARNLKASTGELVGTSYVNGSPYPFMVDPHVPAMAANAKSILFGDWSRYFVRIVNGVRFERSDEFAFDKDLCTFRAILRADGALIDVNSIKHLANSAT